MPSRRRTYSERGYTGTKRPARRRATANARGYNYSWQQASERLLAAEPYCRTCKAQGRDTIPTCVDHIIPHRGNMRLFWDPDNWQPLCEACHTAKTQAGQ